MWRRWLAAITTLAAFALAVPASAQGLPSGPGRCSGSFVNPITDVCWGCMFPLSLGSLKIWPSSRADTKNPDLPICACGTPVPRVGLAMGFWEPVRLVDVSTKPWCFPNLGGIKLDPGFSIGNGYASNSSQIGGQSQNTAKYHVHYYIYPLLYWLEVVTDFLCLEASSFDVAYMSERQWDIFSEWELQQKRGLHRQFVFPRAGTGADPQDRRTYRSDRRDRTVSQQQYFDARWRRGERELRYEPDRRQQVSREGGGDGHNRPQPRSDGLLSSRAGRLRSRRPRDYLGLLRPASGTLSRSHPAKRQRRRKCFGTWQFHRSGPSRFNPAAIPWWSPQPCKRYLG